MSGVGGMILTAGNVS